MLSLAHFSEFGHYVPYKLKENFDRIRLNYGYFTLKLVRLKFSYTIWGTGNDLRPLLLQSSTRNLNAYISELTENTEIDTW